MKTNLAAYDNSWYRPGSLVKRVLWHLTSLLFFRSAFPFSGVKTRLLRVFGARVGRGVVIKPHVTVKYPWFLSVGDHSWIGEGVWIDNLARVVIGTNVCLSQGACLLTGNHNYKKSSFDLVLGPVTIEDGVWIGAKAVVCPGVTCYSHSVLSVGGVATADLRPYTVYAGNPASKRRERVDGHYAPERRHRQGGC